MYFFLLLIFSEVQSADIFVSPVGSGTACTQAYPCGLQEALTQANDNDVIYVAEGTYTGTGDAVVTLTKTIQLLGGWDGSSQTPVVRNRETYPTIIDGEDQRRGISISGSIAPTIDGFTITRGKAPDGGGIYIHNASPLIRNNTIASNRTITGVYNDSRGGGFFADGTSSAVVTQNQIYGNNSGYGGGIYSASLPGGLHLTDNIIYPFLV